MYLSAAATFLEQHYKAPRILIGHSFGATACLKAAMRIPAAKAVATTIDSPAEPRHENHLLQHARKDIERHGEAEIKLSGKPLRIKKQFLDDLETAELEKTLLNLDRALLVLHCRILLTYRWVGMLKL